MRDPAHPLHRLLPRTFDAAAGGNPIARALITAPGDGPTNAEVRELDRMRANADRIRRQNAALFRERGL